MTAYFKHKFIFSIILLIGLYPILIIIGVIEFSKESMMRMISIILVSLAFAYMIHLIDKENEK